METKKMSKTSGVCVCALFFFTLIVGCVDDESEISPPPSEMVECQDQSNTLESLSEVGSFVDVSASDLIEAVDLDTEFVVQYGEKNTILDQDPLGGEATLSLNSNFDNAVVTEHYSQENTCPSRLEVEFTVAVQTADGVLDEILPARLIYSESEEAITLDAKFEPENLNGTFELSKKSDASQDETLNGSFIIVFEKDHVRGEMTVSTNNEEEIGLNESDTTVGRVSFQNLITWHFPLES